MKRRAFLRGMMQGSVITLGLPWLEIFHGRQALANSGFPLRFGMFFWGNGNRPERWTPSGEGTEWELSEELEPLAPFKDKISVISGMSVKVPNTMPHSSGLVGLMTGQVGDGDDSNWTVAGPSIDQLIAAEIGGETVYRSIIAGCVTSDSCSWNGPNARNPVESDPYAFYEPLFVLTFHEPGEEVIIDPRLGFRRSVLDSVMDDISVLNAKVGSEDKIRLEQHLDGVRELEQRLARLQEDPPSLEACLRPDMPESEYPELEGRPQFSEKNAVMSKMIAMSLACDQTRVLQYTFTQQLNNHLFPNTDDGHHNLTHHEPGEQPQVHEVATFCMNEFAVLLNELDSIQEGEGTLLDNCIFMANSEVSEGRTHSLDEIPFIIAGGTGKLQTGIHYRSYTQENVNKAILSIIRAMGINQASHGDGDSFTMEGLSAIEL